MTFDPSSRRQEVVKQQDKQARLDQFLGFYLDRIFADWTDRPDQAVLTVLARSPESPVARAIALNSPDLLSAGVAIRAVFARLEPAPLLNEWTDLVLVSAESESAPASLLARIKDPALDDLHEQLVIGSEMSWTGDALRRDPLQRDTIEVYDPCCPSTARMSARTFERIWDRAEPIRVAERGVGKLGQPGAIPVEGGVDTSTAFASTRH